MVVAGKACRRDVFIDRGFGRETVKPAAPHQWNLVDKNIALRAQFTGIARLAKNAPSGIAASVAKLGKGHLDQRQPLEMRNQEPRILVRLEPYRGGVRLVETGSSSRKRYWASTIECLLEGCHADAAIGVEEALIALAECDVTVGHTLDCVDNPVFIEAGPGDLAERDVLGTRSAE